ncbi:MAG TPA: response regulator [Kofleriaceae bacterium]|nr:response regulator [Kofleriaceae bacterium]
MDDEPDILDFLERALRRRYEVTRFSDPAAALAAVKVRSFDVLITDQKMPGVSGLELLETVADLHPRTVRVLISGFTDAPEIAQALAQCRIHNFVLKPVDSEQLIAALEVATRRAGDQVTK